MIFCTAFVTVTASNGCLSSQEISVSAQKAKPNSVSSLGNLDPGPRPNPQNLLVLIGSHFTSYFSARVLSWLKYPHTSSVKGIFIFGKFLGFSHV